MCCFLPVHSWHSSLPFSFFDCDFFFLPCFNSEAKGPQPAKSHRSSLAKPQKAWLPLLSALSLSFSMYDYSMRPPLFLFVRCSTSLCLPCLSPSFLFSFLVCLHWSYCLFVSISLLFFSRSLLTNTHTHTHTHHPLYFSACQSVTASGLV